MRTRIWPAGIAVVAAALTGCTSTATSTGDSKDSGSTAKADSKPAKEHSPEDDVKITACSKDEFGNWPQAKLSVTNHSSKTSDYIVSVEFLDASGTRKAEGTGMVNKLAHGQTAEETAGGTAEVSGKVTCRITDVTRTASL
ncbi:hypothetical protein [Streptomyces carpinensis]|uniref:Lipoprotein n=1 Tax=Streptomyces carpinensis TaxID=66369 RepID=A0ABV1WD26_9ACTN|nr:hypothetical protein [Streptomyces carpinensis]